MSKLKLSSNLFLERQEIDSLVQYLDDDGWKVVFKSSLQSGGILRSPSDTQFANFRVDVGTTPGKLKINAGIAVDMLGNLIRLRETRDNVSFGAGAWYWIKVKYVASSVEVGTVDIDAAGNLTGSGTAFTKVLRGLPNFASRIKFYGSSLNTSEYDVAYVNGDTSAILAGIFQPETGLKYSVIGTFTPGHIPVSTDKEIFRYDDCTITFVPEIVVNTPPSSIDASQEFWLARVRVDGTTVQIQDKRTLCLTNSNFAINALGSIFNNANPIAGVDYARWDVAATSRDKNEVAVSWGLSCTVYAFDSNLRQITLTSFQGGRSNVSPLPFSNGDFVGWRLYAGSKSYVISQSVIAGSAIQLTVPGCDPADLIGTIYVVPDADRIEIRATGEVPYNNQTVYHHTFDIQMAQGKMFLPVPTDVQYSYMIEYRYVKGSATTKWQGLLSTPIGYYSELSFNDDGSLKSVGDRIQVSYVGGQVSPDIVLTASPKSFNTTLNTIYKGDLIGTKFTALSNSTPVVNLVVGSNEWIQVFEGNITFGSDIVINLSRTGIKSGNYFRLIFNCIVQPGIYKLTINDNYVNPGAPGTVLFTATNTDWSYCKYPTHKLVVDCHTNGSVWTCAVVERDHAVIGDIKMRSNIPSTWFDGNGRGLAAEVYGWQLCNGQNGSVDLRDRFVVGYDDRTVDPSNGIWDSNYNTPGTVGGQKQLTLTTGQLPPHTHTISTDGDHIHPIRFGSGGSGSAVSQATYDHDDNGKILTAGAHNHGGATGSTGTGDPIENRPPYFTIVFLQRIE